MYMYIVKRTQIYLKQAESTALDREARRTGRTRSQLIREAIAAVYLGERGAGDLEAALLETAGGWKRRTATGMKYVERLRRGRRLKAATER
jgi:predicted transcriptional regulator